MQTKLDFHQRKEVAKIDLRHLPLRLSQRKCPLFFKLNKYIPVCTADILIESKYLLGRSVLPGDALCVGTEPFYADESLWGRHQVRGQTKYHILSISVLFWSGNCLTLFGKLGLSMLELFSSSKRANQLSLALIPFVSNVEISGRVLVSAELKRTSRPVPSRPVVPQQF